MLRKTCSSNLTKSDHPGAQFKWPAHDTANKESLVMNQVIPKSGPT